MEPFNFPKEGMIAFTGALVVCRSYLLSTSAGPRCVNASKPPSVQWLNKSAFDTLVAICDAILPSIDPKLLTESVIVGALKPLFPGRDPSEVGFLAMDDVERHGEFFRRGAVSCDIPLRLIGILERDCTPMQLEGIALMLSLLASPVGCLLLTGYLSSFHHMSLVNRTRALRGLRDSSLQPMRCIFQLFRRLSPILYLSDASRGKPNPTWKHIQYDPSISTSRQSRILPSQRTEPLCPQAYPHASTAVSPWSIEVDVVVVGSGAGGGVMASELAKTGLRVLVLEKGGYFRSDDFRQWGEMEANTRAFEKCGSMVTKDSHIPILAGSCVGGGTTVNWSASFDTPATVREDWVRMGLQSFAAGEEFDDALTAVKRMIGVNTRFSYREDTSTADETDLEFVINDNNRALWEAAKALGMLPERIPRNVQGCVDCGSCSLGCSYHSKQSTVQALLEPVAMGKCSSDGRGDNLQLIPYAYVRQVLVANGKASGVVAVVDEYDESVPWTDATKPLRSRELTVTARVVVCSAGSIHTPALLLRSGMKHPLIGKNLTLHPVVGVNGWSAHISPAEKTMPMNRGVGMGVVVRGGACESACDPGYGVAVETPPMHAGTHAWVCQWNSGLQHRLSMLNYSRARSFIAISRDHSQESNCVSIDEDGCPVVDYTLTPRDEKNVMNGLIQQLRLMRAAGVCALAPYHEHFPFYCPSPNDDDEFEAYLNKVRAGGIVANSMSVFSAHQMSSCRMATAPSSGPVSPSGELWECRDLFVADASVFPTSLGINPMITTEAVAFMLSRRVMQRLAVDPVMSCVDDRTRGW